MIHIGTYAELLSTSPSLIQNLQDIDQDRGELVIETRRRQLTVISYASEKGTEEELATLLTYIDTKQEGTVKWNVYASYIKAGFGTSCCLFSIILIYIIQQAINIYSGWWLASWSDDESHRHRVFNVCLSNSEKKIDYIRSMNNNEWNAHRNQRFYIYSSRFQRNEH